MKIVILLAFVLLLGACSPGLSPAISPSGFSPVGPRIIGEWAGSGDKNTEPFTISRSPWTIEWEKSPTSDISSLLLIEIYYPGADMWVDYISSGTGLSFEADTGYIYKTGTFYLDISGLSCDWKVKVIDIP